VFDRIACELSDGEVTSVMNWTPSALGGMECSEEIFLFAKHDRSAPDGEEVFVGDGYHTIMLSLLK
jgi:hypothetical protein